MQPMDGHSADITETQKEKLRGLFPDVFSEGKIDWNKLKAVLGEEVDLGERYSFSWKGKSDVYGEIQKTTTKTLKPAREESVNYDETENLFIEGDNLEALKVLQKSYFNKIKMVYIDPPYNTGNDFVYNDKRQQKRKEYETEAGIVDEEGKATRADGLSKNSKDSGHFHSNWLNMMYPRLYLARNLLRQDGVIFVSIGEEEVHNLRMIMNQIFGEENFIADFLWKKKGTTSNVEDAQVSSLADHTLCFKRSEKTKIAPRVTLKETRTYPHQDKEGSYRLAVIEKKDSGSYQRDSMKFEIIGHKPRAGKRWQIGKDTADLLVSKNRFIYKDEKVKLKIYDFEDKDTKSAQSNLLFDYGSTESGAQDIELLFGIQELFDNPKPKELIMQLIKIATTDNDIVLDFFSGSGTTAHAIMALNAEVETSRRSHIQVQLPELTYKIVDGKKTPTKEQKIAFNTGYETIADIAKERIRRAGKKIVEDNAEKLKERETPLDTGFKVLKVDETNFKVWDNSVRDEEKLKQQMLQHLNPVKDGAKEEDLLTELLLKSGISFDTPIKSASFENAKYYIVESEKPLIICLAKEMTEPLFQKLLAENPTKIIFLDSALKNNDQLKTNLLLQSEKANVEVLVV